MPQVDYPRANWIRVAIRGQGIPAYLREDAFSVGLMALWNADRQGFPPWQAAVHLKRRLIDFTRKETMRRVTVMRGDQSKIVWVPRGDLQSLGDFTETRQPGTGLVRFVPRMTR